MCPLAFFFPSLILWGPVCICAVSVCPAVVGREGYLGSLPNPTAREGRAFEDEVSCSLHASLAAAGEEVGSLTSGSGWEPGRCFVYTAVAGANRRGRVPVYSAQPTMPISSAQLGGSHCT